MKNKTQSFDEIKAAYPDCFVLMKDVVSEGINIKTATLVYKNKNQDKVWKKANELKGTFSNGNTITIRYTGGKLDERMANSIFIL